MRNIIFIFIFFILFLLTMFVAFKDTPMFLSDKQIAERASRGCPKSEDMNGRFDNLYHKFGKGKTVPFKFISGQEVKWEQIYYNIDYLLEDK